ncbi:unnamed protein product, partial [marine sediment metagenome]
NYYYAYRDSMGVWRGKINTTAPDLLINTTWAYGASIAIDSNDGIHIVVSNGTDLQLQYITWNISGSTWDISNIMPIGYALTVHRIVETDASNRPHIIWRNTTGLMYTYFDGSKWRGQADADNPDFILDDADVNYLSLALNSSGSPHVSYTGLNTYPLGFNSQVNHTWWDGDAWNTECIIWHIKCVIPFQMNITPNTCIEFNRKIHGDVS